MESENKDTGVENLKLSLQKAKGSFLFGRYLLDWSYILVLLPKCFYLAIIYLLMSFSFLCFLFHSGNENNEIKIPPPSAVALPCIRNKIGMFKSVNVFSSACSSPLLNVFPIRNIVSCQNYLNYIFSVFLSHIGYQ